ncbi:hypothetical protein [Mariprofundus ferrooxydans]|uniref:Phosphoenolpyruvate synthase n=1 Tax=Mariprofundus ferrooxydans PV-1 TaxID=314345 RepID=Q0EYW7_9PROT|nr:hypothetical protein [Mariprofundus ferrooxydans]EAU54440.1 phosphoenolpyruvate synthase [Mariprofundus ferrooxydans PV-1]KON48368.1 phosphoenolpyruvate synthase [Mariprofundus ferrooxydans]
MSDGSEINLTACEKDFERWYSEHQAWLDDLQHWQSCEHKVVGIIFELEAALPGHRAKLDQFHGMVMDHKQLLEKLARSFASLSAGGDGERVAELERIYHKAAVRHEEMATEYGRLESEYELALTQLQNLAERLQCCLNRSEA